MPSLSFLHHILKDLSAHPSIHARQPPGGMGDPMLSDGQILQARVILSNAWSLYQGWTSAQLLTDPC
jgi:hypothetical protein